MKSYSLAKPYIDEKDINAVVEVLRSSTLSRGPNVKEFETQFKELTGSPYASAVSSGTAGLILALQALGISSGDEVITVSFTVPATLNSILALGATPKMIDIEETSLGMCPQALRSSISKKTKAVIVVHAFGMAAKIEEIISICEEFELPVVEDACEAVGNYFNQEHLGTFADIGVFGFYPNKQITTGEGGMVITKKAKYFEKIERLKNHGRTMDGSWLDQIDWGWNFRLSDLNAALGVTQVLKIKEIKLQRQKIAKWYTKFLQEDLSIKLPRFQKAEANSAWFVYVIQVPKRIRDLLVEEMLNQKIQCGKYFAPVHLQPYFKAHQNLKKTEKIALRCLALPFYHDLQKQDIRYIACRLKEEINKLLV